MIGEYLELVGDNKYLYRIEIDVDYQDCDLFSIVEVKQGEKIDQTVIKNLFNGKYDIEACLENGCRYILNKKGTISYFEVKDGKINPRYRQRQNLSENGIGKVKKVLVT